MTVSNAIFTSTNFTIYLKRMKERLNMKTDISEKFQIWLHASGESVQQIYIDN